MNSLLRKAGWLSFAILGALVCSRLVGASASETEFPYIVPVETWQASGGFRAGDQITIRLVRGDRPRIEVGGKYLVLGTYTLRSDTEATLALSLTARGSYGSSRWAETQRRQIAQGDGQFALSATMQTDGEFHVSFYFPIPERPGSSNSRGGIYFDNR